MDFVIPRFVDGASTKHERGLVVEDHVLGVVQTDRSWAGQREVSVAVERGRRGVGVVSGVVVWTPDPEAIRGCFLFFFFLPSSVGRQPLSLSLYPFLQKTGRQMDANGSNVNPMSHFFNWIICSTLVLPAPTVLSRIPPIPVFRSRMSENAVGSYDGLWSISSEMSTQEVPWT